MRVLAVVHGDDVRPGLFHSVVEARGYELEHWRAWNGQFRRPLEEYGAVLVFGGSMHADQDDRHPWLREEDAFLQRLLEHRWPVLGICLGAQLLAKAAGSWVAPAGTPEIGWYPVELSPEAAEDPVLGCLPPRFDAFQWHYYTHGIPTGATELARSDACTQAYRLGESAWGVQFHPEVTRDQVERWLLDDEPVPIDRDRIAAETDDRIGAWNTIGRTLCNSFLDAAERRQHRRLGSDPFGVRPLGV
jgi:GMP synthase (glutamine-hydrolysing)